MKLPQFEAINTFLGNLERSLSGTHHAFDFARYAHRHLAEAQYRFNRRFNLRSILARPLRAASATFWAKVGLDSPSTRRQQHCRHATQNNAEKEIVGLCRSSL